MSWWYVFEDFVKSNLHSLFCSHCIPVYCENNNKNTPFSLILSLIGDVHMKLFLMEFIYIVTVVGYRFSYWIKEWPREQRPYCLLPRQKEPDKQDFITIYYAYINIHVLVIS